MGDLDGLAFVSEQPGAGEGSDDRFCYRWAATVLNQFGVGDPPPRILRSVADPDQAQEEQACEFLLAVVQPAEGPLGGGSNGMRDSASSHVAIYRQNVSMSLLPGRA